MNLGYACINMQLSYPTKYGDKPKGTEPITTGRGMIKRTFESKGVDYASEITLANVKDLHNIMAWNVLNGHNFYRMTSGLAPWKTEYEWDDLKDIKEIKQWLRSAGTMANTHGVRVTSHPGPFNVLVSPNENVVENTFKDLIMHGDVFDFMGLSRTHYNKINIHCNGVYGDKQSAMDRFCKNFERLPDSVKSRLTVENDDKASMYSVKDLMYIHGRIGIPIVFDYHHHKFCTGDLSEQQALELAMSTWPDGIVPVVHYSESKAEHQLDESIRPQAHSDLINKLPDTYGNIVDIMVEAKHKELAIREFMK
jgi:UV DNA damage endonuclease|tara:strand:+ start:1829 stop:2755 length:927 start_codon:yes stop_codon:yes gene_type:complete